jgi:hypothetical protein
MSTAPQPQQHVITAPSRVEHYAVRRRDWLRIRNSLQVCRPATPWMEPAGWATIGASISGGFTYFGLSFAAPPAWLVATIICASALFLLMGGALLAGAYGSKRVAQDRVSEMQRDMDEIAAECDRETAL